MVGSASSDPTSAFANRLSSFQRVKADVYEFLEQMPVYSKRDGSAVIYAFNSLFDISWKLMKDSLADWYGLEDIKPAPRDIIKTAGTVGLIENEERWLSMLKNRNLSTHDYMRINQKFYCELIQDEYLPLMEALETLIVSQIAALEKENGACTS